MLHKADNRGDRPPTWEIEWHVVDIACEVLAADRSSVSPDSRLFEDLHLDSLDAVEFMMELEERFGVTLSAADCREWFADQPATLGSVAKLVVDRWGTGNADRRSWTSKRKPAPVAPSVPPTQLDDWCTPREWLDGELYQAMGENREGHQQYRRRSDGMRCVLIPGSEVAIGNPQQGASLDQRPVHRVELREFLIDAEPVSNAAFCRFLNSVKAPVEIVSEWYGVGSDERRAKHLQIRRRKLTRAWSPLRGTEQKPVMLVSWFGANAYSLWANRQDWRSYRGSLELPAELVCRTQWGGRPADPDSMFSCLPSEVQWEYAALGAASTPTEAQLARHRIGAEYTGDGIPAADVNAELGKSDFGLHHMAGNVWQWCRDWYSPTFYQSPEATRRNAQNSTPTAVRSERGGSWVGPEELGSRYYRRGRLPTARGRCLGFRCVGDVGDLP